MKIQEYNTIKSKNDIRSYIFPDEEYFIKYSIKSDTKILFKIDEVNYRENKKTWIEGIKFNGFKIEYKVNIDDSYREELRAMIPSRSLDISGMSYKTGNCFLFFNEVCFAASIKVDSQILSNNRVVDIYRNPNKNCFISFNLFLDADGVLERLKENFIRAENIKKEKILREEKSKIFNRFEYMDFD